MKIEYTIKGITLTEFEMYEIRDYYEAACTAEFIMENHNVTDVAKALACGYEVRRLMREYNATEAEAIEEVVSKYEDKEETK